MQAQMQAQAAEHRYNIEITEDDPRAAQPERITAMLKPHQLALLHKACKMEREGRIMYNVPNPERFMQFSNGRRTMYKDRFTIRTNIGMIGDIVGYGKTLVALSIVATTPTRDIHVENKKTYTNYSCRTNTHIHVDFETAVERDTTQVFATTLVVVPKGPVYLQWQKAVTENTTLRCLCIDDLRMIKKRCPPTMATNAQLKVFFEGFDMVLIKNTSIDKLIDHYEIPFRLNPIKGFERIMIDEAHDIMSRLKMLDYKFLWMITASYKSVYSWGTSNNHMSVIVKELLNEERMNTILVKCENNFTKKSFEIPAYRSVVHKCMMHRVVSTVLPFLSKSVINRVNANDIAGAIVELGGNAETEDNIINVVTTNIQRDIRNKEKEREYVLGLDIGEEARAARLKHISNDLERLNEQMKDLTERVNSMNADGCSICYDELVDPILLSCTHMFCGKCILKWIEVNDTNFGRMQGVNKGCPKCRAPINRSDDLTAIVKRVAIDDEAGPSCRKAGAPVQAHRVLSKCDTIVKIIEEKPQGKFLIFSQHDSTFLEIVEKLASRNIRTSELMGTTSQMDKILERFRNGETRVIMLNTYHAGSGIDISYATDVILFHSMEASSEQAIGRAQRVGRTDQLTVHWLCYPHEVDRISSTRG